MQCCRLFPDQNIKVFHSSWSSTIAQSTWNCTNHVMQFLKASPEKHDKIFREKPHFLEWTSHPKNDTGAIHVHFSWSIIHQINKVGQNVCSTRLISGIEAKISSCNDCIQNIRQLTYQGFMSSIFCWPSGSAIDIYRASKWSHTCKESFSGGIGPGRYLLLVQRASVKCGLEICVH